MTINQVLTTIFVFKEEGRLISNNPDHLQKLMYFYKYTGYDFRSDVRGPYSNQLYEDIEKAIRDKLIRITKKKIKILKDGFKLMVVCMNDFIKDKNAAYELYKTFSKYSINDLTLLTTVHSCAHSLYSIHKINDIRKIIETVKSIQSRPFTDDQINSAIVALQELELLSKEIN
jgi:uncharacterized protein YwgA